MFGPSVHRGPGRRRSVALTFDDGPGLGSLEVARVLRLHGIRATFFLCGANVERHPAIAAGLAAAGHELGNHTFSHRRLAPRLGWKMNLLSPAEIFEEFARAQATILLHTGVTPRLLRAPYGMRWLGVRIAQQRLGLLGVMWTAITQDWVWDAKQMVSHMLSRAHPGAILCMHDGRDIQANPDVSATVEALEVLVPELQRRGYSFETVSQILEG